MVADPSWRSPACPWRWWSGIGGAVRAIGSIRGITFGALIEPTILFVVFAVALITRTDLPYALSATIRSSASQMVRPSHVLAAAAFFLVALYTGGIR